MDLISKNAGVATPVKNQHGSRSKKHDNSRYTENLKPNVSLGPEPTASPASKSTSKNANPVVRSPRNKILERKFVVAKKKSKKENPNVACKCKEKGNSKMCLCVAYENLRASQEEFFKKRNNDVESESLKESDRAERELEEAIDEGLRIQDLQNDVAAAENEEVGLVEMLAWVGSRFGVVLDLGCRKGDLVLGLEEDGNGEES